MQFDLSGYTVEQVTAANSDLRNYLCNTVLKMQYVDIPSDSDRVAAVDNLCESFYNHFGKYPNSVNLYYLSNYVLLKDIKSNGGYKKRSKVFFLSPRQLRSRYSREFSAEMKIINHVRTKQVHNIAVRKSRYRHE